MHINSLELLAASLAAKTFLRDRPGTAALLQMDNTAAVAYINNLGGTVSPQLTSLAKSLWLWALERDIMLSAQHIPGITNLIADSESRSLKDRSDWMLCPQVFARINQIFGPMDVDLFASRLTHQLPRYFSWRLDPQAEAVDAFQQNWAPLKGFANPPWCLLTRVLNQLERQEAQVILVAPVWKGQPWYPVLLAMLCDFPRRIPLQPNLLQSPVGQNMVGIVPQLAVWPISGISSQVKTFQKRLLSSSCHPGGLNPTSHMIHSLENGLAGVLNEVVIPFQDL